MHQKCGIKRNYCEKLGIINSYNMKIYFNIRKSNIILAINIAVTIYNIINIKYTIINQIYGLNYTLTSSPYEYVR